MERQIIPAILRRGKKKSRPPYSEYLKREVLYSNGETLGTTTYYTDKVNSEQRLLCPDRSLLGDGSSTITFPLTIPSLRWYAVDGTVTNVSLASNTWVLPNAQNICEIYADLDVDLYFHYKLIEGFGTTIYDSSGEGGHATISKDSLWNKGGSSSFGLYTGSYAETGNYANIEGFLYADGTCIPWLDDMSKYANGTEYKPNASGRYRGSAKIHCSTGGGPACDFSVSDAKVYWPSPIISGSDSWTMAMWIKGGFPSSGYASFAGSNIYPGVESLYGVRLHSSAGICCYTYRGTKYSYAQPPLATLQNYVAAGCSLVWRFNKAEDQYKIKFWINGYTEDGWYINCGTSTPVTPYLYLSSLGIIVTESAQRYTGTMWDFRAWNTALSLSECAAYHTDTMSSATLAALTVWLPNICDGIDVVNNLHATPTLTARTTAVGRLNYMLFNGYAKYSTGISIPNGSSSPITQQQVPYIYGTTTVPTGLSISGEKISDNPHLTGYNNGALGWIDSMPDLDIDGTNVWNTVGCLAVQYLNKANTNIYLDGIRTGSTYDSSHPGRFTGPGLITYPTGGISLIKSLMVDSYEDRLYLFHLVSSVNSSYYSHARELLIYNVAMDSTAQTKIKSWGGNSE